MEEKFDSILDKCIDRINRGDRIEDCLADYPEYATELEPLLQAMLSTKDVYSFKPQASAKQKARQQFNAALRESEQRQEKRALPLPWIFGKARAWAVIATLIVIALGGYFAITQLTSTDVILAETDPEGNFAFLISDAPNAIGDFQSLDVVVSKIRLRQEDGDWVEFIPESSEVDLSQLQGDLAQQVWRGDVPQDQYSAAVLYVTSISGILTHSGDTVDIKLPGDKLHLDMDFEVSTDPVVEFVYDVTVISTGSGRYNLQPVVKESGTNKDTQKVNMQGQDQNHGQNQGQGQGQGQGHGAG